MVTPAEVRVWVFTELAFGGTPVKRGGSLFELKPVTEVLRTPEQAHKVRKEHGVTLRDFVLVETLPSGEPRNHWGHVLRDEPTLEVPA